MLPCTGVEYFSEKVRARAREGEDRAGKGPERGEDGAEDGKSGEEPGRRDRKGGKGGFVLHRGLRRNRRSISSRRKLRAEAWGIGPWRTSSSTSSRPTLLAMSTTNPRGVLWRDNHST